MTDSGGVLVRAARPGDGAAVRAVVRAAFGAEGAKVERLVDALDEAGCTRADLVAEVAGVVVGHARLSRSWVDARERLVEVLVLSPLAVAPAHQRGGIGTTLLAATVDAARDLAAPVVFLEGSPAYYGSRGFRRGSELGFGRPSVRIPEAAFQCLLLPGHEAWMGGALVYCEPFWTMDAVGLRDPLLARLERELG